MDQPKSTYEAEGLDIQINFLFFRPPAPRFGWPWMNPQKSPGVQANDPKKGTTHR